MFKGLDALTSPQRIAVYAAVIGLILIALVAILYALTDRIADGGEAVGREKTLTEQKENADAEIKARFTVRSCLRSGRVWRDDTRDCVDPVPAPRN